MIHIRFKNLDRSALAEEATFEKVGRALNRIPKAHLADIQITLEKKESPRQSGPDLFVVHLRFEGGAHHGLALDTSAPSLYVALADMSDCIFNKLKKEISL